MVPVALRATARPRVVVMGVSGCGKSTVGALMAARLGCSYLDGDDLHPPRNLALMAAGTPLTDDDRHGWLAAVAQRLSDARTAGQALVVGCSALKRRYRDQLRAACPGLQWVHLHGRPELLQARMAARSNHYMPTSLLASQLATLEPPGPDEAVTTIDIDAPVAQLVAAALAALHQPTPPLNPPHTPQQTPS